MKDQGKRVKTTGKKSPETVIVKNRSPGGEKGKEEEK